MNLSYIYITYSGNVKLLISMVDYSRDIRLMYTGQ